MEASPRNMWGVALRVSCSGKESPPKTGRGFPWHPMYAGLTPLTKTRYNGSRTALAYGFHQVVLLNCVEQLNDPTDCAIEPVDRGDFNHGSKFLQGGRWPELAKYAQPIPHADSIRNTQ